MALTPQQEAYLIGIADAALAEQAYVAKIAELDAARAAAQSKLAPLPTVKKKADILSRQAEIAADPEVVRLTAEAEALKP